MLQTALNVLCERPVPVNLIVAEIQLVEKAAETDFLSFENSESLAVAVPVEEDLRPLDVAVAPILGETVPTARRAVMVVSGAGALPPAAVTDAGAVISWPKSPLRPKVLRIVAILLGETARN